MRPGHWTLLIRASALVALAASAALYVDYTQPTPTFCSIDSGCAAVRESGYGYILLGPTVPPIPVPLVGLVGVGILFAVALFPPHKWRDRLLLALGLIGGAAAIRFIVLQAAFIHRYCKYCVTVDTASLAIAGLTVAYTLARRRAEAGSDTPERLKPWAWSGLAALAITAPLAWPDLRPLPAVPAGVRALYVPGKINVVEFADFECPFCRRLYPRLDAVMKDYPGRVHFVRLNFPLSIHPYARVAAHASVCASDQGNNEPMAHVLFTLPELSLSAIRRAAVGLGLDMDRFDKCVNDPKTDQRVNRQEAILKNAGFEGLPTTFVGDTKIIGAQPKDVFRDAFERAAAGDQNRGIPAPLYLAGVVLAALALVFAGKRKKGAAPLA
jgi:uncharacterized membrane protein